MSDKLKSRKLWVLIALVALIVGNYLFGLGMPPADVLYLVILGASYILGQGYVDAQQKPVQQFPVEDVSQSVLNIVKTELEKTGFGQNTPLEKILEGLMPIFKQELGKLSFTVAAPADPEPAQPVVSDQAVQQG